MNKGFLEIKCGCGHYNVVPALKIFLKRKVLDEKQRREILIMLPAYKVSDVFRCEKCGKSVANAGELFRVRETVVERRIEQP